MKQLRAACFVIAAFVLTPCISSAGVSIELKNGNEILADECRESDDRLICYKMGGAFEIEKQDIRSINRTKKEPTYEPEKPAAGQTDTGEAQEKPQKGDSPKDTDSELKARLDLITQRKRELQSERGNLADEREKLNKDVKDAPDWMATDRFEDLQKRMSALDEKIKTFNAEVNQLNQEEKTIIDSLQKKQ